MNGDGKYCKEEYNGYIYRFRQFSESGAAANEVEEIFTERKLWFCSPKSFNDPFDCMPNYVHCSIPLEEAVRRTHRYIRRRGIDPESAAATDLLSAANAGYLDSDERKESTTRIAVARMENRISMCCLCGAWDVPSMWAHYADNHSGYSVGFEQSCWAPQCVPLPVEYVIHRPSVDLSHDYLSDAQAAQKLLDDLMLSKARCWEHEREFRMIRPILAESHQPIPAGAIKEVILGYKISPKNRERVLKAVSASRDEIELYDLTLHPTDFSFSRNRIG